jgi:hypothetical protein
MGSPNRPVNRRSQNRFEAGGVEAKDCIEVSPQATRGETRELNPGQIFVMTGVRPR